MSLSRAIYGFFLTTREGKHLQAVLLVGHLFDRGDGVVDLNAYIRTYIQTYKPSRGNPNTQMYQPILGSAYLCARLAGGHLATNVQTYMQTYKRTNIHTYTCLQACIHTYTTFQKPGQTTPHQTKQSKRKRDLERGLLQPFRADDVLRHRVAPCLHGRALLVHSWN